MFHYSGVHGGGGIGPLEILFGLIEGFAKGGEAVVPPGDSVSVVFGLIKGTCGFVCVFNPFCELPGSII